MKKFIALLSVIVSLGASAQTTIYNQTFNSTYTDWTLNTSSLGSTTSTSDNQWVVNNVYAGFTSALCSITVPATANEPSGITGYPNSDYLHIFSEQGVALCMGTPNCNYDAGTADAHFAEMNTPIATTGYTGVSFSFWWLCQADVTSYGTVYYRTSSSGTWTAVPGSPSTYYGSSSWALQTVSSAVFDGQSFLEFGFQFTVSSSSSGNDPAFAIDDVKVTGTLSSLAASFTANDTVLCQDSCVTFTNTSTGTASSYTWACSSGFTTTTTSVSTPVTVCFSVAGVYTMSLTAVGTGSVSSIVHAVTVNAAPAAITGSASVCIGHTEPLADGTPGGTWSSSNSYASVGTSGIVTGLSAGIDTISYTLPTGCKVTHIMTITPTPCTTGIGELPASAALDVYPNPTEGQITLQANPGVYRSYCITNQVGQSLLSGDIHTIQTPVDVRSLPPGLYYILIRSDNGNVARKFVKE